MPTDPNQDWDGRTHPTQDWDGRTHPTQDWDGPAQIILTQPQQEFNAQQSYIVMGPITRRCSTVDIMPNENTCLCGDCCCCCTVWL
jgi:hypothetical protein